LKSSRAQLGLLTKPKHQPDVIKRQGKILRRQRTLLEVELFPVAGCVGCEKQRQLGLGPGHCGIDLLGLSKSAHNPTVQVPINPHNSAAFNEGDTVEVQLPAPNAAWVVLAARVYGVPTLGLILGATLGSGAGEPVAVVLAALGLCAGLWFGRRSVHVPQSMAELCGTAPPAMRIVNTATEARS